MSRWAENAAMRKAYYEMRSKLREVEDGKA